MPENSQPIPPGPGSYVNPYRLPGPDGGGPAGSGQAGSGQAGSGRAGQDRRRIGPGAIVGLVLSTVVWVGSAPVVYELLDLFLRDSVRSGPLELVPFFGIAACAVGVVGFIVAFSRGNRRLAARLYNWAALAWVVLLGALVVVFFMLLTAAIN
ncbi:hypothetical protein BN1051_01601 [Arthrobacter saudimassiliensis]|uniref:Uncharacterized protein n=1 Tax=Arthrobacter saudimassiliensis TaxID=1461584 RepID=A0A078MTX6_9MICC|nr:hypothetical protein BN1051_01601 [Arthrobacter saudimassiliensis]